MTVELITPPAALPLTLQECKSHLRLEDSETDQDALIMAYLRASVEVAEGHLRRALITRSLKYHLAGFPQPWQGETVVYVPQPPLIAVTSIDYLDDADAAQVLATSVYQVDTVSTPGRVLLRPSQTWPTTSLLANAVSISYDAGYGADGADVPEAYRLALLLLVAHSFAHREPAHDVDQVDGVRGLLGLPVPLLDG